MDFKGNQNSHTYQIDNVVLHMSDADPTSPVSGQLYLNTTKQIVYLRIGTAWYPLAMGDNSQIPSKSVLMWNDLLSKIPYGFAHCDGTNDTPAMSGKFAKCIATSTTNPGTNSTESSHSHPTVTHTHNVSWGNTIPCPSAGQTSAGQPGGGSSPTNTSHGHTYTVNTTLVQGTSTDTTSYPPFYEIAFIVKA